MSSPDCPECGEHFMGCPCSGVTGDWASALYKGGFDAHSFYREAYRSQSERFDRIFGRTFDLEMRIMKLEERLNNLEKMQL